jgi:hypothetical protein
VNQISETPRWDEQHTRKNYAATESLGVSLWGVASASLLSSASFLNSQAMSKHSSSSCVTLPCPSGISSPTMNLPSMRMLSMELSCNPLAKAIYATWILPTFMLYGYSSLGEETPPSFFTSSRHLRRVVSWL